MHRLVDEHLDALLLSALVFIFCFVGILTLDDYGLTFDETWHFFAGERYLRFWNTLDRSLLDWTSDHPTDNSRDGHPRFDRPSADEPRPAVANTLSALSCRLFFSKLGWLDAVDAHHLPIVLMGGGTLAIVYCLGRDSIGRRAAVFGTLALGLSPRFLAHSHFNIKDAPKTFFFSLTIWGFWKGATRRDCRWVIASGVFFGLALGTRINALLIPFIVAPWLAALLLRSQKDSSATPPRWWLALLAAPLIALVVWVLTWPLMLFTPLDTVRALVSYWRWLGYGVQTYSGWNPYALLYVPMVTPPMIFLLGSLGIVIAVLELGQYTRLSVLLLLLWIIVPVLRTALPHATNYDGIRQFMEFLPAFCLLAGLAAQRLLEEVDKALNRGLPDSVEIVLFSCAFLPAMIRIAQIHPNELVYFNAFVGRVPGARRLNLPDATDYWGSSHRQAIDWLNTNAESGASIYVGDGNANMVGPVRHTWMREDLHLILRKPSAIRGSTPVYVSHVTRPMLYDAVDRYCENHLDPIHSVNVDGEPVLNIFRLEASDWRTMLNDLAVSNPETKDGS